MRYVPRLITLPSVKVNSPSFSVSISSKIGLLKTSSPFLNSLKYKSGNCSKGVSLDFILSRSNFSKTLPSLLGEASPRKSSVKGSSS